MLTSDPPPTVYPVKEKLDLYQAELGGLGNLRVCGVPPSPGHHAPRNAEVGQ